MTDKIQDKTTTTPAIPTVTVLSNEAVKPALLKKPLPKFPKIIVLYFVFIIFEVFSGKQLQFDFFSIINFIDFIQQIYKRRWI